MRGLRHLIEQTSRFEAVLTRSNFNSHLDSLPLCFLRDNANEVRSKYFVLSSSFLRVVCFRLWSISFTIFLAKHKSDPILLWYPPTWCFQLVYAESLHCQIVRSKKIRMHERITTTQIMHDKLIRISSDWSSHLNWRSVQDARRYEKASHLVKISLELQENGAPL